MKRALFVALISVLLTACGAKVYNKQLKDVELGMTRNQVEMLMGEKYIEHPSESTIKNTVLEKIEYQDRYKFRWFFIFENGYLIKWYKGSEKV